MFCSEPVMAVSTSATSPCSPPSPRKGLWHCGCHNWLLCRKQVAPTPQNHTIPQIPSASFLVSTEQLSMACVGPEVFCNCTTFLPPEAAARDNTGMRVFQAATCPSLQRRGTSSSLLGVWNLQDVRRYSSLEKSFCLLCYFTTGNP